MRKALPYVNEERVVTSQVRLLLALLLCHEDLISIARAAAYAEVSIDTVCEGVGALKAGDSRVWTMFKDEVDDIHHALVVDQDALWVTGIDFPVLWRKAWSRSIYGSPQNLITMQATIRHQLLTIKDDGLHNITHIVASAAYDAYCAAGRFDRTATVVINGKLLREAISIV